MRCRSELFLAGRVILAGAILMIGGEAVAGNPPGVLIAQSGGTRAEMRYCYNADQQYGYVASPRCQKGDDEISYEEYQALTAPVEETPPPDDTVDYGPGGPPKDQGAGYKGPPTLPDSTKEYGPPKDPDAGYTGTPPLDEAAIPPKPSDLEEVGSGTGFFVDTQGHLLTNAHVVDGCVEIGVLQEDGVAPTQLLQVDEEVDLALLESDLTGGTYAVFRSTGVEIGEPAYAVGFPLLGVLSSINMTNGIISSLTGPSDLDHVIQTTAPIHPGNSGGPLVDEGGSVIGVVVATGDPTLTQNLGWAIRGDVALEFLAKAGIGSAQTGGVTPISARTLARDVGAYTVPLICYQ